MKNAWTNKEIEKLFLIAKKQDFKNIEYEVKSDTLIIKKIFNEANLKDRDEKAVLYKLAEMKFFNSRQNSKKEGVFYRNDQISFDDFKTAPCYKKMTKDEQTILSKEIPEKTPLSYDVDDLCQKLSNILLDRSPLNMKMYLYKQKYIALDGKGGYQLQNNSLTFKTSNAQSELDNLIKERKIPETLKKEINAARAKVSEIYNPYKSNKPRVIFSNDGTGFGKSYGVFDQFISNTNSEKSHKNMFFITPMKSQIKIDESQIIEAKNKGIEFLSYLSRTDISNLHFHDWITGESNLEKYKRWEKINKKHNGTLIKEELSKLNQTISYIQYIESRLKERNLEFSELNELNIEKSKKENQLINIITNTSLKIINLNTYKLTAQDIFKRADSKDDIFTLYADIIKTSFPIEFSKFKPCILLATTDKFDVKIAVLKLKKNKSEYTTEFKSFYEILGHKMKTEDDESLIGRYVSENFSNQVSFLKEHYFITDHDNYFRKNNISFHVVIDEEHDSYKTFFQKGKINLMDEDCKLEDVLAAVYRLYLTNEDSDSKFGNNYSMVGEEGEEFFKKLNELFKKHCDISNSMSLNAILKIFSNNINGIAIDGNQIEHISNITKNVFNFSSKRFFNENSLKSISFRSHRNDTVCEIYTKTDETDSNPTMYDIYQLIMVILAACSQIKKSGKLHKSLGLRDDKNHNRPLHIFINKAISVRKDVEYIFNRTDDEDLIINHFFTYFQPKTIFSIERRDDFNFIPESKGIIYVDFSMELRKELPEINILKLLHNTNNSIVTLSATSGIKNNFTGNYNRKMLATYGQETALDYGVVTRSIDDASQLEKLREKRGDIRQVKIEEIEKDSNLIIKNEEKEFKTIYNDWESKLKNYTPYNKYHKIEHKRQLKSLLLAAYDEKNTLILSLTNNFLRNFKDYLENNSNIQSKQIKVLDKEGYAIFDFKPFKDKPTLRVILFNSDLDKRTNVREFTEINDVNTKLVFISSYNSAGTGLNYFAKYVSTTDGNLSLEEDFERLVLVNTPFYSEVKEKGGLNTIDNYITLLKYFSEEARGVKHLKDFNTNLVNGENYNILMNEHNLAVFKVILQAIGRVERKDTKMTSEIFIPSEVVDSATLQFVDLNKNDSNQIMINSMSLLNTHFMNYCLDKGNKESFLNDQSRLDFEEEIKNNYEHLKTFVNEILLETIRDYRKGSVKDISLNEDFRHKDTIFDPKKAMEKLKNNNFIKNNGYEHIIDMMYIDTHREDLKDIKLCSCRNEFNTLTDINHGFSVYQPYELIIPNYNGTVIENKNSLPYSVLNNYYSIQKESRFMPNPYLLPLLMGNMGELLFKDVLKELSIEPLSVDDINKKLDCELYELFDFYIEVNDSLICIDVKNWSSTFEKSELSINTQVKAEDKINTVKKVLDNKHKKYEKVHYVYINSKIENNELNVKPEMNKNENVYYLNLFKHYEEYKTNQKNVNKVQTSKKVIINDVLSKLIETGDI